MSLHVPLLLSHHPMMVVCACPCTPVPAAVRQALAGAKQRLQQLRLAQKQRFAAAFQKGLLHMPADDEVEEYDYYLGDLSDDEDEMSGDDAGDAGAPAGDTHAVAAENTAVSSNGAAGKPTTSSSSSISQAQTVNGLPLKAVENLPAPGDNLFAPPSQFVSPHPKDLIATMGWDAEEVYKDPLGLFTGKKKAPTGDEPAAAAAGAAIAAEATSNEQQGALQHAPQQQEQSASSTDFKAVGAGGATPVGTSSSNGGSSLHANSSTQHQQQQQRWVSFQPTEQEGPDLDSDESETWGRAAVAGAPWGEEDLENLQELSPAEVTAVTVPVTDPWYVEHRWGQPAADATPAAGAAGAARQVAAGSSCTGALQGDHHTGTSAPAISSGSQANGHSAAASSSAVIAPATSQQQQAASSSTTTPAAASKGKGLKQHQQQQGGPPLSLQEVQAAVLEAARAAGDMEEEEAAEVLRPASPRSMAKQLGAWFNVSAVKRQH